MPKKKEDKPVYNVNWYDDKYQSIVVFRNWLLLITLLAIVGILLMTAASYYFVPLKSVSPFVVQIDEKSGITQVVDIKSAKEFTTSEQLIKYFAMKYIHAHEDFNYLILPGSDNLVRLMSAPDVYSGYREQVYNKATGYYNVFGASTNRTVALNYVVPRVNKTTGETQLEVHLDVREVSSRFQPTTYAIAVNLTCFFDPKFTLNDEERLVNPLGFRVVYYNAVKESNPDVK